MEREDLLLQAMQSSLPGVDAEEDRALVYERLCVFNEARDAQEEGRRWLCASCERSARQASASNDDAPSRSAERPACECSLDYAYLSQRATQIMLELLPEYLEWREFEHQRQRASGADAPCEWSVNARSYEDRCLKPAQFTVANRTLTFRQRHAEDDAESLGMTLWDGSVVLARYLEARGDALLAARLPHVARDERWRQTRIVEIGAGCGLAGMAAAALGAQCTLTELGGNVLRLLRVNVRHNFDSAAGDAVPAVCELRWSRDFAHSPLPAELRAPYDIVLGADVIYQQVDVDALVATLRALCDRSSLVILACEKHDAETPVRFRAAAERVFSVRSVPRAELPVHKHDQLDVMHLRLK